MSEPLTPEERTGMCWREMQEVIPLLLSKQDIREMNIIEKHIAAAVADARNDERAKIILQIEQQIPRDLSRVHWSHAAQFKAIQQIIQQEPTQ